MKILLFSILLSNIAFSQVKINNELRDELIEINSKDQNLRYILFNKDKSKYDSISTANNLTIDNVEPFLIKSISELDSINILRIDQIINKYGYPGTDLVGERYNNIAWAVIQHSKYETQKKYLPILKKAVENKQLKFSAYATTIDRILVKEKKPQIYGTQVKTVTLKKDNKKALIFWPIKDSCNINQIRKSAGFYEWRIKKYAKNFNIKYKAYTIDQIKL